MPIRIDPKKRAAEALIASRRYAADVPLRTIAEELGRSYGYVHRLLKEAGTPLRPRGGRRKKAT